MEKINETHWTYLSDSFKYEGRVKVSLLKGNKKYFTQEFKNKGRWPLFNFFTLCLAGDYNSANLLRPRFINLFDFTNLPVGSDVPNISDEGLPLADYFNANNCVSLIAYPMMASPDIETHKNVNIGSSEITFKFTIPFTQVSLKPNGNIKGFALYAQQTTDTTELTHLDNYQNPVAFFFLTDENGKIKNLLNNQITPGEEYNISIEWKLSISNQTTINN